MHLEIIPVTKESSDDAAPTRLKRPTVVDQVENANGVFPSFPSLFFVMSRSILSLFHAVIGPHVAALKSMSWLMQ